MKKPVFPLFSKIAWILSGILLSIYLLIEVLELLNIYLYVPGIGAKEIIPFLMIPCAVFLISAVAVFSYKNCKHILLKILVILLTVILAVVAYFYILFSFFFTPVNTYFEFTSDDQQHTIVVNEMSWLLAGGGDLYEKTSFCTMKKVGTYATDDGFCPFTNNAFYFVWNENNFELHYHVGNASGYRVEIMEYAD